MFCSRKILDTSFFSINKNILFIVWRANIRLNYLSLTSILKNIRKTCTFQKTGRKLLFRQHPDKISIIHVWDADLKTQLLSTDVIYVCWSSDKPLFDNSPLIFILHAVFSIQNTDIMCNMFYPATIFYVLLPPLNSFACPCNVF